VHACGRVLRVACCVGLACMFVLLVKLCQPRHAAPRQAVFAKVCQAPVFEFVWHAAVS
jgi:hypothetical protein